MSRWAGGRSSDSHMRAVSTITVRSSSGFTRNDEPRPPSRPHEPSWMTPTPKPQDPLGEELVAEGTLDLVGRAQLVAGHLFDERGSDRAICVSTQELYEGVEVVDGGDQTRCAVLEGSKMAVGAVGLEVEHRARRRRPGGGGPPRGARSMPPVPTRGTVHPPSQDRVRPRWPPPPLPGPWDALARSDPRRPAPEATASVNEHVGCTRLVRGSRATGSDR